MLEYWIPLFSGMTDYQQTVWRRMIFTSSYAELTFD